MLSGQYEGWVFKKSAYGKTIRRSEIYQAPFRLTKGQIAQGQITTGHLDTDKIRKILKNGLGKKKYQAIKPVLIELGWKGASTKKLTQQQRADYYQKLYQLFTEGSVEFDDEDLGIITFNSEDDTAAPYSNPRKALCILALESQDKNYRDSQKNIDALIALASQYKELYLVSKDTRDLESATYFFQLAYIKAKKAQKLAANKIVLEEHIYESYQELFKLNDSYKLNARLWLERNQIEFSDNDKSLGKLLFEVSPYMKTIVTRRRFLYQQLRLALGLKPKGFDGYDKEAYLKLVELYFIPRGRIPRVMVDEGWYGKGLGDSEVGVLWTQLWFDPLNDKIMYDLAGLISQSRQSAKDTNIQVAKQFWRALEIDGDEPEKTDASFDILQISYDYEPENAANEARLVNLWTSERQVDLSVVLDAHLAADPWRFINEVFSSRSPWQSMLNQKTIQRRFAYAAKMIVHLIKGLADDSVFEVVEEDKRELAILNMQLGLLNFMGGYGLKTNPLLAVKQFIISLNYFRQIELTQADNENVLEIMRLFDFLVDNDSPRSQLFVVAKKLMEHSGFMFPDPMGPEDIVYQNELLAALRRGIESAQIQWKCSVDTKKVFSIQESLNELQFELKRKVLVIAKSGDLDTAKLEEISRAVADFARDKDISLPAETLEILEEIKRIPCENIREAKKKLRNKLDAVTPTVRNLLAIKLYDGKYAGLQLNNLHSECLARELESLTEKLSPEKAKQKVDDHKNLVNPPVKAFVQKQLQLLAVARLDVQENWQQFCKIIYSGFVEQIRYLNQLMAKGIFGTASYDGFLEEQIQACKAAKSEFERDCLGFLDESAYDRDFNFLIQHWQRTLLKIISEQHLAQANKLLALSHTETADQWARYRASAQETLRRISADDEVETDASSVSAETSSITRDEDEGEVDSQDEELAMSLPLLLDTTSSTLGGSNFIGANLDRAQFRSFVEWLELHSPQQYSGPYSGHKRHANQIYLTGYVKPNVLSDLQRSMGRRQLYLVNRSASFTVRGFGTVNGVAHRAHTSINGVRLSTVQHLRRSAASHRTRLLTVATAAGITLGGMTLLIWGLGIAYPLIHVAYYGATYKHHAPPRALNQTEFAIIFEEFSDNDWLTGYFKNLTSNVNDYRDIALHVQRNALQEDVITMVFQALTAVGFPLVFTVIAVMLITQVLRLSVGWFAQQQPMDLIRATRTDMTENGQEIVTCRWPDIVGGSRVGYSARFLVADEASGVATEDTTSILYQIIQPELHELSEYQFLSRAALTVSSSSVSSELSELQEEDEGSMIIQARAQPYDEDEFWREIEESTPLDYSRMPTQTAALETLSIFSDSDRLMLQGILAGLETIAETESSDNRGELLGAARNVASAVGALNNFK